MTNTTPNKNEIRELFDATAFDNAGDKLGSVKEVFLDDRTGQPTFIEVGHGLFGMSSSLVPLRGSSLNGDSLNLGFAKDTIKDAPNINADNGLSVEEENDVYAHYGLSDAKDVDYFRTEDHHPEHHVTDQTTDGGRAPHNTPAVNDTSAAAGTAAATGMGAGAPAGANRSDADTTVDAETDVNAARDFNEVENRGRHAQDAVLEGKAPGDFERTTGDRVGGETTETNRAPATGESIRLRKYIVHDTETVEVPVEREEVRIDRTDSDGTEHGISQR